MKQETKQTIKKLIISVLVIAIIVGALFFVLHRLGLTDLSREQLQEYISSFGPIAPIIFIVVSFLQVTFVPIPGAITILVGNYLFGPVLSFIYSYIGALLGAMFAFALGKWIGRPFADWLAGGKGKVDEWLIKLRGKENVLLFFMFFFPFFPDDLLCAVAGLMPISWGGFFLMQVVTRATSTFGTLFFMSGEIIPWRSWGLVVLALVAIAFIALFIICFKNAERIDGWFSKISRKVYFGERYFIRKLKKRRDGKKVYLGKSFEIAGVGWCLAAVYNCPEGIVIDFYSSHTQSNKPIQRNFDCVLIMQNGDSVFTRNVFELEWNTAKKRERFAERREIKKYMQHYKLSYNSSRTFVRVEFALEGGAQIKHLLLFDKEEHLGGIELSLTPEKGKKTLKNIKEYL